MAWLQPPGRGIAAGADAISPALGSAARGVGNMLMGTASTPGNAITNAVVRPASLAANGAVQGAVANTLTGDPNNTVGQNLLMGAGAGAAFGPAAAAIGAGARGTWNALTGTFAPFYAAGRDAIADNVLAHIAADGPTVADTTTYVPGVTRTLAQATANPGLAGAERAVAAIRPNQFAAQAADNNDARTALVDNLRGTPTDIQTAQATRDATAVPAITGPIANATAPADASPVVSTIDQILASPAGQRDAVVSALGNIRSKLVTPIPFPNRVATALDAVNQAAASNPGRRGDCGVPSRLLLPPRTVAPSRRRHSPGSRVPPPAIRRHRRLSTRQQIPLARRRPCSPIQRSFTGSGRPSTIRFLRWRPTPVRMRS